MTMRHTSAEGTSTTVACRRMAWRCGLCRTASRATPQTSTAPVHNPTPNPGVVLGGRVIPAEILADLARRSAVQLRPLVHPGDIPPEPRYRPSAALADFVRCRDLTCRFPGCDRPAYLSDLDHTIPYDAGGLTHASNNCLVPPLAPGQRESSQRRLRNQLRLRTHQTRPSARPQARRCPTFFHHGHVLAQDPARALRAGQGFCRL